MGGSSERRRGGRRFFAGSATLRRLFLGARNSRLVIERGYTDRKCDCDSFDEEIY